MKNNIKKLKLHLLFGVVFFGSQEISATDDISTLVSDVKKLAQKIEDKAQKIEDKTKISKTSQYGDIETVNAVTLGDNVGTLDSPVQLDSSNQNFTPYDEYDGVSGLFDENSKSRRSEFDENSKSRRSEFDENSKSRRSDNPDLKASDPFYKNQSAEPYELVVPISDFYGSKQLDGSIKQSDTTPRTDINNDMYDGMSNLFDNSTAADKPVVDTSYSSYLQYRSAGKEDTMPTVSKSFREKLDDIQQKIKTIEEEIADTSKKVKELGKHG